MTTAATKVGEFRISRKCLITRQPANQRCSLASHLCRLCPDHGLLFHNRIREELPTIRPLRDECCLHSSKANLNPSSRNEPNIPKLVLSLGSSASALLRPIRWKSASEKRSCVRPSAVSPSGTNGLSLPKRICVVGTRLVSAAIAGRLHQRITSLVDVRRTQVQPVSVQTR